MRNWWTTYTCKTRRTNNVARQIFNVFLFPPFNSTTLARKSYTNMKITNVSPEPLNK